jgi:hypothetical protein
VLAHHAEGRSEPASARLSPVTRDYPSRVSTSIFRPKPPGGCETPEAERPGEATPGRWTPDAASAEREGTSGEQSIAETRETVRPGQTLKGSVSPREEAAGLFADRLQRERGSPDERGSARCRDRGARQPEAGLRTLVKTLQGGAIPREEARRR